MIVDKQRWVVVGVVLVVVAVLGYGALTMQDRRSVSEKVSDAVDALPEGASKAEQQLESRTPGQKLGDKVKDMGDKIKDNTNSSGTGN